MPVYSPVGILTANNRPGIPHARVNEAVVEIKPGVYVHWKGGKYNVLGTTLWREAGTWFVVYHKLYGEDRSWEIKPVNEFTETITRGEYTGPRYRLEWNNVEGPKP